MSSELNHLLSLASAGKMSRREFVGRAGALGVSTAVAGTMLSTAAFADTPVKGGLLRAGMQGGESTNTLDPALAASDVPFMINSTWGETLVDVELNGTLGLRVAEEVSSNADATQWMFKIRKGVEYHNGATMTAEDVVATLKRHTDDKAQSGAQGIVKGITDMKAEGDMVTLTLAAGNADLPFLMADYHLVIQPGGGVDNPAAGIGSGAYKVVEHEPGVRTTFELAPGVAFGERNPDMQQWVARKLLAQLGASQEHYVLGDVVQFPTPDGHGTYAGAVMQVSEDGAVLFDFNHPLAGHPVTFEVHVIGIL